MADLYQIGGFRIVHMSIHNCPSSFALAHTLCYAMTGINIIQHHVSLTLAYALFLYQYKIKIRNTSMKGEKAIQS